MWPKQQFILHSSDRQKGTLIAFTFLLPDIFLKSAV